MIEYYPTVKGDNCCFIESREVKRIIYKGELYCYEYLEFPWKDIFELLNEGMEI